MAIGERLKTIRDRLTQKEFGEKIGVSQGAVQNYEATNSIPKGDILQRIRDEFEVSIDWLLTGEGDPYLPKTDIKPTVPPPESAEDHTFIYNEPWAEDIEIPRPKESPDYSYFQMIPLAEAHLSAGGGAFVISEDMKENYAFRRDWLNRVATSADNLVLMMVRGTSMEPTIMAGDMVLIDKGRKRVYEGLIYAIGLDETIVIKRLTPLPGGRVMVVSDNRSEYQPQETLLNNIRVIGRVIWFGRQLVQGEE